MENGTGRRQEPFGRLMRNTCTDCLRAVQHPSGRRVRRFAPMQNPRGNPEKQVPGAWEEKFRNTLAFMQKHGKIPVDLAPEVGGSARKWASKTEVGRTPQAGHDESMSVRSDERFPKEGRRNGRAWPASAGAGRNGAFEPKSWKRTDPPQGRRASDAFRSASNRSLNLRCGSCVAERF
jgi:hypothetical protein